MYIVQKCIDTIYTEHTYSKGPYIH